MLRRLLATAALVGATLIAPASIGLASADTAQAACQYRQAGTVWKCITPGAFCPAAAHSRYGYAKVTNKKYRCKSSSPRWRWLKP